MIMNEQYTPQPTLRSVAEALKTEYPLFKQYMSSGNLSQAECDVIVLAEEIRRLRILSFD
jgi:hypothetical protein